MTAYFLNHVIENIYNPKITKTSIYRETQEDNFVIYSCNYHLWNRNTHKLVLKKVRTFTAVETSTVIL